MLSDAAIIADTGVLLGGLWIETNAYVSGQR